MGDISKERLLSKICELHWIFIWFTAKWARQDSNLRPTGYEPAALPLSYKPILSAMKGFIFHGNQICVEREMELGPTTTCLEEVTAAELRFPHLLNLKSEKGTPLSAIIQVTGFFYHPQFA